MPNILIDDERHGKLLRMGINGRNYYLPTHEVIDVDDALLENLRDLDVSFVETDKGAGSSSKEGSGKGEPARKFTAAEAAVGSSAAANEAALQQAVDREAAAVETAPAGGNPDLTVKRDVKRETELSDARVHAELAKRDDKEENEAAAEAMGAPAPAPKKAPEKKAPITVKRAKVAKGK